MTFSIILNSATLWKWNPYVIPALVFITYFILSLQAFGISHENLFVVCISWVTPMGREKNKQDPRPTTYSIISPEESRVDYA